MIYFRDWYQPTLVFAFFVRFKQFGTKIIFKFLEKLNTEFFLLILGLTPGIFFGITLFFTPFG